MSPLRHYTAIVWFIFTVFDVADASSLFGVSSVSSVSSISLLLHQRRVMYQLRGGDDGKDEELPAFRPYLPYTLAIRDSIMIAHSFHNHPSFGPASGLHGATYTVDVEFASRKLHPECNWVIDIGVASDLVAEVLKKYNYKNLDEVFREGIMTTTEFMCREIHKGVVEKLKERYAKDGDKNDFNGWIKVSLWESHKAWASFDGPAL